MSSSTARMGRRPLGWRGAAAATMLLAGLAVPAPAAAAVHEPAVTSPAADIGGRSNDPYVRVAATSMLVDKNFATRCLKHEAVASVNYEGAYRIVVGFGGGRPADYTDYTDFANRGMLFRSRPLDGSGGDGGHLYGTTDAPLSEGGRDAGVLGVTVTDRKTGDQLAWYLWEYTMSCGCDYHITISDDPRKAFKPHAYR